MTIDTHSCIIIHTMKRINLHVPEQLGKLLDASTAKNNRSLTGEIIFQLCKAYGVPTIRNPSPGRMPTVKELAARAEKGAK